MTTFTPEAGANTGMMLLDIGGTELETGTTPIQTDWPRYVPPTTFYSKKPRQVAYLALYVERLMKLYNDLRTWFNDFYKPRHSLGASDVPEFKWYRYAQEVPIDLATGEAEPLTGRFTSTSPGTPEVHPDAPSGTTDPEESWVEGRFAIGVQDLDDVREQVAFRKIIDPLADDGSGGQIQALAGAEMNFVNYWIDLQAAYDVLIRGKFTGSVFDFHIHSGAIFDKIINQFWAPGASSLFWGTVPLSKQGGTFNGSFDNSFPDSTGVAQWYYLIVSRVGVSDALMDMLRPTEYWAVWKEGDSRLFIMDMLRAKKDDSGINAMGTALTLRDADANPILIRNVHLGGNPLFGATSIVTNRFLEVVATDGEVHTISPNGKGTGVLRGVAASGTPQKRDSLIDIGYSGGGEALVALLSNIGTLFKAPRTEWFATSLWPGAEPSDPNNFPFPAGADSIVSDSAFTFNGSARAEVYVPGSGLYQSFTPLGVPSTFQDWIINTVFTSFVKVRRAGVSGDDPDGWGYGVKDKELSAVRFKSKGSVPAGQPTTEEDTINKLCDFSHPLLPDGELRATPIIGMNPKLQSMDFQLMVRIPNYVTVWQPTETFEGVTPPFGSSEDGFNQDGLVDRMFTAVIDPDGKSLYPIVIGDPRTTQAELGSPPPDDPELDSFNIIYCGLGNQIFRSLDTSKATVPAPVEVDDVAVGDATGKIEVTVLGSARGRFTLEVQDDFDEKVPVVVLEEDGEIEQDATGGAVYQTVKRKARETWRVFERTWPINAGSLATRQDLSDDLPTPFKFYDNRAHLDIMATSLRGFAPIFNKGESTVLTHKEAGGTFLLKVTSSNSAIVEVRRDIYEGSGTPGRVSPFESRMSGEFSSNQAGIQHTTFGAGAPDPAQTIYVGSDWLRLECKALGSATITVEDVGSGRLITFELFTWRVIPLTGPFTVGTPVSLEIEGTASLPITWTVETDKFANNGGGPGRVSASTAGLATIANDPTDPKKAILLPLAATTDDTGKLRIKATDFNEGFYTLIDLEIIAA